MQTLQARFDALRVRDDNALDSVEAVIVPLKAPPSLDALPQLEGRAFFKRRDELVEMLMVLYGARVFGASVAAIPVSWSKRLNTTAGITKLLPSRTATVELAIKVVDTTAKLANTLCHELCHAAMWIVDGVKSPPHGDTFKRWARRAEAVFPQLAIGTCHSYEINFKYRWQCAGCPASVGRHSKSLDTNAVICKRCGGKFVRVQ